MLDACSWSTPSNASMEKDASCWSEVVHGCGRALDGVEGRLSDKMKERMGIVAEEGRGQVQ